jgi:hypothetical protein
MKKFAVALAAACAFLACIGGASAARIGVAEDAMKYANDGGSVEFAAMNRVGLTSNRMTVFWDWHNPTAFADKAFLDRAVAQAAAHNVDVVLAIYTTGPNGSGAAKAMGADPEGFCSFAKTVVQTYYPVVTKFIVGNEPNQARFWGPQVEGGQFVSPRAYEQMLELCYPMLKSVGSGVDVIGVGLSPNGTDVPSGDHISRSPVRFIADMADEYRSNGATTPLMDELAFHCYPSSNAEPLEFGYRWPNVGCVNLSRLKQAFWDGFNGTPQRTIETGATLMLDEIGWQVDTAGMAGYSGTESSRPVTTEARQGDIYAKLVRLANCDPSITALHFFHLVDESDRDRFQSGLFRVGLTERAAASRVRNAIAVDGGGCNGKLTRWSHATGVVGASLKRVKGGVLVSAEEGYTFSVSLKGARPSSGSAKLGERVLVKTGGLKGRLAVTLKALMNPSRTTTLSQTVAR